MVKKGVLVGTAAAIVLGVAFVAAALVSRPREAAPETAPRASKVRITLVAPREPAAPASGPKLETVPAGAPDASAAVAAPPPLAAPPPAIARSESSRLEPEPADDDFLDERERAWADRYPPEPDRESGERGLQDRDDGEPYFGRYRRDDDRYRPAEPYDPEPPPWWRR